MQEYIQQQTCNQSSFAKGRTFERSPTPAPQNPEQPADNKIHFESPPPGKTLRALKDLEHPFTRIDNRVINDLRLSALARFAMVYLLSKKDDWKPQIKDLMTHLGVSRYVILRVLKELKEHGYYNIEMGILPNGRKAYQQTLYESPSLNPSLTEDQTEAPSVENQHSAPSVENQHLVKKGKVIKANIPPSVVLPTSVKRHYYKQLNSETTEQETTNTQTTESAAGPLAEAQRVCVSRYSLEEISSYVRDCQAKGQPIHNPPGLVISLQRNGLADVMIEAYLRRSTEAPSQEPQTAAVKATPTDVHECPDCRGTGFWYPEGHARGVAKCHHPQLSVAA